MEPTPQMQAGLALAIFLGTLAYEDGATLFAAALAAGGRLDVRLGLASAFLGIWAGDIGLYALGSGFGSRIAQSRWLARFLTTEKLARAEEWFSRRGSAAIVISRLIPGSRLPLYVTAGAIRVPLPWFVALTGACGAIWVSGIFLAAHLAPVFSLSMYWKLGLALPVAALLLAPQRARSRFHILASRECTRLHTLWRKYSRWEFWPGWFFYPPVAAMCAWLSLRYRGFALPTVANPSFHNGGMVGESKIEVLQALMRAAPESVAAGYEVPAGGIVHRLRRLETICAEHSIGYPFVLKPNVGQRGAGFKLVTSPSQAVQYLLQVRADLLLQRYVCGPKEAGVFYYRFPGWEQGRIFAITEKIFPSITGDGVRTFDELIAADPRASLIARTYLDRFPGWRGQRPAAGQQLRLVEAGNHCQGCIFRDGSHLNSPALLQRMDQISRAVPGFFIGRYDIRYECDEELRRGANFQIIELNGAASEATNIYDERNSLLSAYRTLYRQWELVYAIGDANRERGHRPTPLLDLWKDWKLYRRMSASYPAAD
jgi:membrane protein DedA with SNARE-associated domain